MQGNQSRFDEPVGRWKIYLHTLATLKPCSTDKGTLFHGILYVECETLSTDNWAT